MIVHVDDNKKKQKWNIFTMYTYRVRAISDKKKKIKHWTKQMEKDAEWALKKKKSKKMKDLELKVVYFFFFFEIDWI